MAALNHSKLRSTSGSNFLEPLMPLALNKDNFFAFRNDGPADTILDMTLKEKPGFTRQQLSSDIQAFNAIMYIKYPKKESMSFCRGSDGISEQYLMARVQAHASNKDAVIYYYDKDDPEIHEQIRSCVGGVMTIKVKPDELHMSGWCIPYKNSKKGLASDFIQILISIAQLNNKRKITLQCYGDDLKELYEKKHFRVTNSENVTNSQNSNSETVTKYDMERLLPEIPGAPRPLPIRRVRHRTRSANSVKKPKRNRKRPSANTPSDAATRKTFLKRRVSRPRSI
jgi:hypothetical protein